MHPYAKQDSRDFQNGLNAQCFRGVYAPPKKQSSARFSTIQNLPEFLHHKRSQDKRLRSLPLCSERQKKILCSGTGAIDA